MLKTLMIKSTLVAFVCCASFTVHARADSPKPINVPSGELVTALETLSKQAAVELVYQPAQLKSFRTGGVKGTYTPEAAIRILLQGTPLELRTDPSGAMLIAPPRANTTSDNSLTPGSDEAKEGKKSSSDGFRLAQVDQGVAGPPEVGKKKEQESKKTPGVEEVIVTGTRVKDAPKEGAIEVRSYSRQQIEESGQPTIARFLNTLPEVSQTSPGFFQTQGAQNVIQLRGFPVGTTLVLLDGRHAPNSGFGQQSAFDINNIPEGMIQRVDILPLGSSAIYGSDGLAGVVNFILRRDLDGGAATATYGGASKYDDYNLSATQGLRFNRGSVGAGIEYAHHSLLQIRDRAAIASGDFSRFASVGGQDARDVLCNPGNVSTLDGSNLPGLSGSFAVIPAGIAGRPRVSDFAPTVGQTSLCNVIAAGALVPRLDRLSGLVYADYDVTDEIHAYGTALVGWHKSTVPSNVFALEATVPASNAFNPFGVDVDVATTLPVGSTQTDYTNFLHVEAGLRGDLLSSWSWDLDGRLTQDRDRTESAGQRIPAALNVALASSDPNSALNLFSQTNPGNAALSSVLTTFHNRFSSRNEIGELVLRGPLLSLPGGPIEAVVGAQYERQDVTSTFFSSPTNITSTPGDRHIESIFGEARVPVWPSITGGGQPLVAVSAAERADHYSDFGTARTPQAGLEIRPLAPLLLRASYSEAFRAPTLVFLHRARGSATTTVTDPQNGNATVVVPLTFGGNPNLKAETGRSYSYGAVWSGNAVPNLTASGTFWHIDEDLRISTLNPQTVLENPTLFPDHIVRNAAGGLVSLDSSPVNFGRLRAEGVDLDLGYRFRTQYGDFTPAMSMTVTTKFSAALQPGQPLIDRLGAATASDAWAPKYKATTRLGWSSGAYSGAIAGRYLGHYLDYQTPVNNNRLGDYWLWDLSGKVNLGALMKWQKTLSRSEISVSAVNLFDRGPQYSNINFGSLGYDPQQFDILGRYVSVRLAVPW